MTITPESIQSTIQSRLLEMVESRHELIKHAKFLASLGISVKESKLYIGECLEAVAKSYLLNLCGKLSNQHANGTPAKIELDSSFYQVISDRNRREPFAEQFWLHREGDLEADKALAKAYIHEVDFDTIARSINEQVISLEEKGLYLLAEKVIDSLNLKCERGYYEPFQKSGRVICQTWAVNYHGSFSKVNELILLKNALAYVQKESNISFGIAMDEYITAIQNLSYSCEKVASRSVFGKGSHLEIACFKDKHEYRFSIPAFEALIAFLMINGAAENAERIIQKTRLLEAA